MVAHPAACDWYRRQTIERVRVALHVRALHRASAPGSARARIGHRRIHAPRRALGSGAIHRLQRDGPCGRAAVGECPMNAPVAAASARSPALTLIGRVLHWLDGVPYTVLAIPLRLAVATVFWNSAMTKLANWDTAV